LSNTKKAEQICIPEGYYKVRIKNPLFPWERGVERPNGTFNLPNGAIGIYEVVGQGTTTITISYWNNRAIFWPIHENNDAYKIYVS